MVSMVWIMLGSVIGAVVLAAVLTLLFSGGDFDIEHFLMWCGALLIVLVLGWFVVAQLRGPAPPSISGAAGAVGSALAGVGLSLMARGAV